MRGCEHVLLVNEVAEEADVLEEALTDASFSGQVHRVTDGAQAMAFLRRQVPFAEAPRPNLILIDLAIAEGEGRQIIHVHGDSALVGIPTLIVCSSSAGGTIMASTHAGLTSYLIKPRNFMGYQAVVETLKTFWRRVLGLGPDDASQ